MTVASALSSKRANPLLVLSCTCTARPSVPTCTRTSTRPCSPRRVLMAGNGWRYCVSAWSAMLLGSCVATGAGLVGAAGEVVSAADGAADGATAAAVADGALALVAFAAALSVGAACTGAGDRLGDRAGGGAVLGLANTGGAGTVGLALAAGCSGTRCGAGMAAGNSTGSTSLGGSTVRVCSTSVLASNRVGAR